MAFIWFLFFKMPLALWAHDSQSVCEGFLEPSATQRQMALAIEIAKMKEPKRGGVFELSNNQSFHDLSQLNRRRLETAVKATYPVSPSPEHAIVIRRYLQNVDFAFLGKSDSPQDDEFISRLLGGTRLTEFNVFAIPRGGALTSFHNRIYGDRIRLNSSFAPHGFVMPTFSGTRNLINFYLSWNPSSIEVLQRQQRFALPTSVRSLEEFVAYVMSNFSSGLFPDDKLRDHLAPLRENLSYFAMTPDDAELFFKLVLEQFLLCGIEMKAWSLAQIDHQFRTPGGVDELFQAALNWIQWDGASLQIPLRVPHSVLRRVYLVETEAWPLLDDKKEYGPNSLEQGPPLEN